MEGLIFGLLQYFQETTCNFDITSVGRLSLEIKR